MTYLSNTEVEKDVNNIKPDKDGWVHFKHESFKDFIFSIRLSDLDAIIEKVEGMTKNSNYPTDKTYNEPRRQEYGFNTALFEVLSYLKSLKQ